jgi:hypothetical protein
MIRPPIIVDARGDVLLFRSVERAEAYLEAVDVRNDEYAAAYDSEGRRLELGTKVVERRVFLGLIRTKIDFADVREADDEASHAAELEQLLRTHLLKQGVDDPSHHSVSELVAMVIDRQGFAA